MTVSWPHDVFLQGKQKYYKTQFLIDKLTNLSCQLQVGIMVLNMAWITLMSPSPHYCTRSDWSGFVQSQPDETVVVGIFI